MSKFDEYRESKDRESRERQDVEDFEKRTVSQRWEQFQSFLAKQIQGMRVGGRRLSVSDHKLVLGRYMTAKFDVVHQVFGRSGPTEYQVVFYNDSSFLNREEYACWPIFLKRLPDGDWGWEMKSGRILNDEDFGAGGCRAFRAAN